MRRTVYFIRVSGGFAVSLVDDFDDGMSSAMELVWCGEDSRASDGIDFSITPVENPDGTYTLVKSAWLYKP